MIKNKKKIKEQLINLYGNRCYICGKEGLPLDLHHIIPLSEGGADQISNLRLICPNHHTEIHRPLREFEFVNYLSELLHKNENFKNIKIEASFNNLVKYRADLIAEQKINNEWQKIVVECKVMTSFTNERLVNIINQLLIYRKYIGDAKFIFAFPGILPDYDYIQFKKLNIEVWDLKFIATNFNEQIKQIEHPYLRPLFLSLRKEISEEDKLIKELETINPGKTSWVNYQRLMESILTRLFCPPLNPPITELSDESKINRRDFILPNYSENGFWEYLRSRYLADFIIIDSKNYSKKIQKKEVLQIANYLKPHGSGLFGIIISRSGGDRSCNITVRDVWIADKKLIIVLEDQDIIKMLKSKSSGNDPADLIKQKIEDFRLKI